MSRETFARKQRYEPLNCGWNNTSGIVKWASTLCNASCVENLSEIQSSLLAEETPSTDDEFCRPVHMGGIDFVGAIQIGDRQRNLRKTIGNTG